ncbi:MAG: OmpA family protein [Nonlabens sp.]|uniref:OmpA family protein n=1 Tax=Nonlabens sp. TaxID=1888209 RepID=UPI003219E080
MKCIGLLLLICSFSFAQDTQRQFSLNFETDSYSILQKDIRVLDSLINSYNEASIEEITIIGYCDDRASKDYNIRLAIQRVNSVKRAILKKKSISDSLFKLHPKGELPLYSSLNKEKQRADNRRVEVMIVFNQATSTESKEEDTNTLQSYDVFTDSLKVNEKLVFNNLIFYPGTHRLREISYPVMDSIINSLMIHKKYEIEIQGHICCNGPNEPGLDRDTGQWNLSTARAEQIKRFFVKYGLDPSRFTTVGKMANFKTGKEDFFDRRVELHITAIRENDKEANKEMP